MNAYKIWRIIIIRQKISLLSIIAISSSLAPYSYAMSSDAISAECFLTQSVFGIEKIRAKDSKDAYQELITLSNRSTNPANKIIGMIDYQVEKEDGMQVEYINNLEIEEAYRGKGLDSQLLLMALSRSKNSGAWKAKLTADQGAAEFHFESDGNPAEIFKKNYIDFYTNLRKFFLG